MIASPFGSPDVPGHTGLPSPAEFFPPTPLALLAPPGLAEQSSGGVPEMFARGADTAEHIGSLGVHAAVNGAEDVPTEGDARSPASPDAADAMPGDGPPAPPPVDGPPAPPEGPPDEPSPAERAARLFESYRRDAVAPTAEELAGLELKKPALNWLSSVILPDSTIGASFGNPDSMQMAIIPPKYAGLDDSLEALRPAEANKIVERQLGVFAVTLIRVQRGVEATADLVEITRQHEGRVAIQTVQEVDRSAPYHFYTGGYDTNMSIITEPGKLDELYVLMTKKEPQTPERPDDLLLHSPPGGGTHMVERSGRGRNRIDATPERIAVYRDMVHEVRPSDTAYLGTFHKQLSTYRELLLQVAEHAGFSRESLIDQTNGQVNMAYLREEIGPAVARPEFQATLPGSLRVGMELLAQAIANKVNNTYPDRPFKEVAERLEAYFNIIARGASR
jgi:hypothetical protein